MKLTDSEFTDLSKFIHKICGISIPVTKKYLIEQRLEPIVTERGCSTYGEYYQKLVGNRFYAGDKELIEAITTNETSFFRDQHPFDAMEKSILPKLIERLKEQKFKHLAGSQKIKIWSAASSYGQEVYSIAMTIDKVIKSPNIKNVTLNDFSILGTDISNDVTSFAKRAVYSNLEVARGLSVEDRASYFDQVSNGWGVKSALKRIVQFRLLNLMNSFSILGSFDIVFCRNVLIYFDLEARSKIIKQIHSMLPDDGYLILGSSENLYGVDSDFKSERIDGTVVYRKK